MWYSLHFWNQKYLIRIFIHGCFNIHQWWPVGVFFKKCHLFFLLWRTFCGLLFFIRQNIVKRRDATYILWFGTIYFIKHLHFNFSELCRWKHLIRDVSSNLRVKCVLHKQDRDWRQRICYLSLCFGSYVNCVPK